MDLKADVFNRVATFMVQNPTSIITKESIFRDADFDSKFDEIYPDFNLFLIELLLKINSSLVRNLEGYLLNINIKPVDRIYNLYQMYMDEYVNQNEHVFHSTHVKTIAYSGNYEVKVASIAILQNIKNCHINCINEARRQNNINLSESISIVDFILNSWDGALWEMEHTKSIKPLFVFNHVLKNVLLN